MCIRDSRSTVRHRVRDGAGRVDDLVRVEPGLAGSVALFIDASQNRRKGLDAPGPENEIDVRKALEEAFPFLLRHAATHPCLLYTSDAADDLLCVDLGGR